MENEAHQPGIGVPQAGYATDGAYDQTSAPPRQAPLVRPFQGRIFGGVCRSVADYAGLDVAIVRVAFAVLCLVGGFGLPLYLAGWLLIPDEGSEESIASELFHANAGC